MSATVAVQAEDLHKTYEGGVEAVKGISFEVAAGESFGLLGPNGAGKTTTIGMLNTSVRPTSGRARLGGHDVEGEPLRARGICSVVFQDPVVDLPLTGRANLDLHMKLWGVPRAQGRARAAELSETVGIADLLDRPVATYSGGQRRRLELIRAMLSDPQVLFLDEPTVGLDTRIRHGLFDVITTLRERTGVTIIMTTHYLDEAERLCDRLAVIEAGTMVACDTPEGLLATVGPEVLELRVDHPDRAADALRQRGVTAPDVQIVGGTAVVSLQSVAPGEVTGWLAEAGIAVRSATTRASDLDDVYLRLTGGQIHGSAD